MAKPAACACRASSAAPKQPITLALNALAAPALAAFKPRRAGRVQRSQGRAGGVAGFVAPLVVLLAVMLAALLGLASCAG